MFSRQREREKERGEFFCGGRVRENAGFERGTERSRKIYKKRNGVMKKKGQVRERLKKQKGDFFMLFVSFPHSLIHVDSLL